MEQKYILKNSISFEPEHIFDCGQCFRWNKEQDGSYTGIINQNVINVKKENSDTIFTAICNGEDIKKVCTDYFDLNRDYEEIKQELSKIDTYLETSITYGKRN